MNVFKDWLDRLISTSDCTKSRNHKRQSSIAYQRLEKRNFLATFTVNTASDLVDFNDGLISLREAITAANTNAAFGDAAAGDRTGDINQFAAGLDDHTIQLTAGELVISDDVWNTTGGNVTLDAQSASRIFSISTTEEVSLAGLTFLNGRTAEQGGAIEVIGGDLLSFVPKP